MDRIQVAGFDIPFGEKAGSAIELVFRALDGAKGPERLEKLKPFLSQSGAVKAFAELIKERLKDTPAANLQDLFNSLRELELRSEKDFGQDGRIGWDGLDWSTDSSPMAIGNAELSLSLRAAGNVYFEAEKEGERRETPLPSGGEAKALAKMVFEGELDGGAKAKGSTPVIAGEVDINADFSRTLVIHMDYPSDSLNAGIAMGQAISRIPLLPDLKSVDRAFRTPQEYDEGTLSAIEYSGGHNLGGAASVKATILTNYGSFSLELGGKLRYGRGFSVILSRNKSGNIQARIANDTENERNGRIEFGYLLGLGDFAPGAAAKLLGYIADADDAIKKVDKVLKDVEGLKISGLEDWLKPGTWIKSKIQKEIGALIEEDSDEARVSWTEFAALFGYKDEQGGSADTAKKKVSEAAGELIAELIDDLFTVDDPGQKGLKAELAATLRTGLSEEVTDIIKLKVLDKLPDLQTALNDHAAALDDKAKKAIQKVLDDTGISDAVSLMRKFVDTSRNILSQIAEKIQLAQTNLVAVELGAGRETEIKRGFALEVLFDPTSASARKAFRAMIFNPSMVGEWLQPNASVPNGLNLLPGGEWSTYEQLHRRSGGHWSLAFVDARLSGKGERLADIVIHSTKAGIAASSKLTYLKERELFGEVRRMTFVSALRLWLSRDDAELGAPGLANLSAPKTNGAMAAPELELSFAQIDNNLRADEIKGLLKRFVKEGLVTSETSDAVVKSLNDAASRIEKRKVKAELSLGLGIPPSRVQEFVLKAAGLEAETVTATKNAIASVDRESIALMLGDPSTMMALSSRPLRALSSEARVITGGVKGITGVERPLIDPDALSFADAMEILDAVSETIFDDDESEIPEGYGVLSTRKPGSPYRRKPHRRRSTGALLKDAMNGVNAAMVEASKALTEFSGSTSAEQLDEIQIRMVKHIRPFMNPGVPGINLIFEEQSPKRIVALFKVLSELSAKHLQIKPPIIVSLKVDGQETERFLSSVG